MRSPENVLESLKSKACNKSYKYERLYRNLYNPQFYLLAYQRIQAKPGNMTAGTDGKTIDGMGMARINALIEKMRDFSYQPNPARRTYIPKSNGKMRPLGIPSFDDKLIQEVVRLILESIYEPTFSEGYTANSVIGRSGMEGLFEKELKGQNGCRIYIVNSEDKEKEELACILVQHGQDIRLTIDTDLQVSLYEQFKEDKSCSVAINHYTGEVLALVSTPAYDNNDFIMGLSSEQWTVLNEDENKPMYNRFRQVWCPGSTFKPIIAAIGLQSGAIDPMEDYGNVGLSWQKDASWGSYHVTTLHAYEPVILENALIYSDNIYFAKAALKIGSDELENSLIRLGFNEELPFEIKMAESQYSNTEGIETEIQLADSGYGQGQILVNPLHMACIYSAFCNEGNVIKPYLVYQNEAEAEYWIPGAFSNETASRVLEGTKKVVNDSNGTGYAAHRDDILLAGKTGTAEIKASKDDTSGTELGWFAIFTAEDTECPILIISMVEDVKGRGGSGYVVKKDSLVLEEWFSSH